MENKVPLDINKSLDIIERWIKRFKELKEKIYKECKQIDPKDFIDFDELEKNYTRVINLIEDLDRDLPRLYSLGKDVFFREGIVGLNLDEGKVIKTPPQKREVMGYYPNSLKKIREIIRTKFPSAEPKEELDDLPSHLLWMLKVIEENPNMTSTQTARWLGYVLGRLEAMGFMTNQESRDIVRQDVSEGYD